MQKQVIVSVTVDDVQQASLFTSSDCILGRAIRRALDNKNAYCQFIFDKDFNKTGLLIMSNGEHYNSTENSVKPTVFTETKYNKLKEEYKDYNNPSKVLFTFSLNKIN